MNMSCISFDSYIKPQLKKCLCCVILSCISFDSYIKPQLESDYIDLAKCCISFDSYIKPQPCHSVLPYFHVVYLLIPTSNHNKH